MRLLLSALTCLSTCVRRNNEIISSARTGLALVNRPENAFVICVVLCLVCVGMLGFYSLLKPESPPAAHVTHVPLFQVIPKRGRINLSPETPTTWWVQTVCLCSLTTSEEGNSWPVTECERQGALCLPRSASLAPTGLEQQSSMKYELHTHMFTVPDMKKKKQSPTRGECVESSHLGPIS